MELELKRAGKVPSFSPIAYSVISSSLAGRVSEDLDPYGHISLKVPNVKFYFDVRFST